MHVWCVRTYSFDTSVLVLSINERKRTTGHSTAWRCTAPRSCVVRRTELCAFLSCYWDSMLCFVFRIHDRYTHTRYARNWESYRARLLIWADLSYTAVSWAINRCDSCRFFLFYHVVLRMIGYTVYHGVRVVGLLLYLAQFLQIGFDCFRFRFDFRKSFHQFVSRTQNRTVLSWNLE